MAQQTQAPSNNVSRETRRDVVIAAERLPMPLGVTERFGIDRASWRALCEAVFPMAKTPGAIVLALAYCRARKLDIFKRVVHIVPMWNSELNREVETVWPGIAEHRITASRTGDYAGNEPADFGEWKTQKFAGTKQTRKGKTISAEATVRFPEWCQITLYRMVQGQRVEFHGPRVYFLEYFGYRKGLPVPNERWTRAPAQMLEKCAEAAALRRAYPEELSEPVAEEMDGRVIEVGGVPVPTKDKPPTADDFPNSQGVPLDGVVYVAPEGDDEDDFSDDPSIKVVDPVVSGENGQKSTEKTGSAPAAQVEPVQNGTKAPAEVPSETKSDGPPEAQEAPPAAEADKGPDGRPEPPPPEGVVDDRPDRETPSEATDRIYVLEQVIEKAIVDLVDLPDLAALKDFQRKARLKIDEADVPGAVKSRLRGKFQAAALDREKVLGKLRSSR